MYLVDDKVFRMLEDVAKELGNMLHELGVGARAEDIYSPDRQAYDDYFRKFTERYKTR